MTILYKLILIPKHYVLQPHVVVEQEAEQSSTQGESSSKIDYDVSILKLDIYRSGIKCM